MQYVLYQMQMQMHTRTRHGERFFDMYDAPCSFTVSQCHRRPLPGLLLQPRRDSSEVMEAISERSHPGQSLACCPGLAWPDMTA